MSSDNSFQEFTGQKLRVFTVDTFTQKPFSGNPAAVCLDLPYQGFSDEIYQKIAAELNMPMTAFVTTISKEDQLNSTSRFRLRWFSPKAEGKFCGHGTLATAFVLFTCLNNPKEELFFETPGGELSVRRQGAQLVTNFPTAHTIPQSISDYRHILKILFPREEIVQDISLSPGLGFLLIRLKDCWNRHEFEAWNPNADLLPSVESSGKVRVVIVTVRGRPEAGYTNQNGECYDFVSRVFTPWMGLPEDRVTGSAHSALAQYWAGELGKTTLYARQCSQRPGDLWLEVKGERTDIKGHAVLVMNSKMTL